MTEEERPAEGEEERPAEGAENEEDSQTEESPPEGTDAGEEQEAPAEEGGEEEAGVDYQAELEKERRRAAYWQRQAEKAEEAKPKTEDKPAGFSKPRPQEPDFDDYSSYVDALTDWKFEKAEFERGVESRRHGFQAKLDQGFDQYDDFEKVALQVPMSQAMIDALYDTDNAADIAYHLGKNPVEARRIASLDPIAAAREIGRLEIQLQQAVPQKNETKAPGATKPVGGKTTIPVDLSKMTTAEYVAHMNKLEGLPVD